MTIFFNSPLKASILCTNKNSKLESFNKRPFLIEIDVNKMEHESFKNTYFQRPPDSEKK